MYHISLALSLMNFGRKIENKLSLKNCRYCFALGFFNTFQ